MTGEDGLTLQDKDDGNDEHRGGREHRRESDPAGHRQDQDPDQQHDRRPQRLRAQDRPSRCRDALSTAAAQERRAHVTQHRGQPSDQASPVVDRSEGHCGSGALGDVQHRDGEAGLAAERTTSVARAGVA